MAQSVSEAMVSGALTDMEQNPDAVAPSFLDLAFPSQSASSGLKFNRGMNTIISGGTNVGQGLNPRFTEWGATREGWKQAKLYKPRNWRRFGTQDYFHHKGALTGRASLAAKMPRTKRPGSGAQYNPFYLSTGINAVGRGILGEGKSGRHLLGARFANKMKDKGVLLPGHEVVSKGFFSRLGAAGRVMNMSDAAFARNASSLNTFLTGAGYSNAGASAVLGGGRNAAASALLTSGGGTVSGMVGGFLSVGTGAMEIPGVHGQMTKSIARGQGVAIRAFDAIRLDPTTRQTARQMASAGLKAAKGATGMASRISLAAKGLGLAGARVAWLGSRFLGPIGAALMVKDAAKLLTWGAGKTMEVGGDLVQSFAGDLRTGIMQQTFQDTEATMTSRARGVQAIQNSRLNARSILGNEAGSMAAHFG